MSKLDLDLEAALKAAEAGQSGGATAPSLPTPKGRGRAKQRERKVLAPEGPVQRISAARSVRVHMFSTRASAEILNALYALARDERRTVTELFEEAVGLLERTRAPAVRLTISCAITSVLTRLIGRLVMKTWPVQDAKARFSELLDTCLREGPQIVTRRGAEAAVLVPADAWRRLKAAARPSLKDLLLAEDGRCELLLPKRGAQRRRAAEAID
jgi:antitoxin Phd